MISDLKQYANISVDYHLLNELGDYNRSTGNWTTTGLYQALALKEVDITATGISFTDYGVSVFDYIIPPIRSESFFFFRMPNLSYTDNVFILPFESMVWLCFVALIVILVIFLTLVVAIEWRLPMDAKEIVSL